MTSMHLPAQDTWTSSSPTTDSLTRYTQTDTHRYTLMNRHIHTNTHLTNTYMHTSVIQHTSTHTLIHTHGQAHTIKHTPHLHTPTLTHSICLACLFPMLTLQHLMSAASIFRSCSHVGLSGPIIFVGMLPIPPSWRPALGPCQLFMLQGMEIVEVAQLNDTGVLCFIMAR